MRVAIVETRPASKRLPICFECQYKKYRVSRTCMFRIIIRATFVITVLSVFSQRIPQALQSVPNFSELTSGLWAFKVLTEQINVFKTKGGRIGTRKKKKLRASSKLKKLSRTNQPRAPTAEKLETTESKRKRKCNDRCASVSGKIVTTFFATILVDLGRPRIIPTFADMR